MSVYTVSQNCKHVGMKKSGYTGNNQDRSGSCYMKQFFIPLRRNGKFYVWNQRQCFGEYDDSHTLRRVWNKHIRKFCILWSFYFKIERRAKCKSPGEVLIFWRSLMAGCQASLQDKNEASWKGPCPVMALSSILFIPTWQMLLNNNDELPPTRMGKG